MVITRRRHPSSPDEPRRRVLVARRRRRPRARPLARRRPSSSPASFFGFGDNTPIIFFITLHYILIDRSKTPRFPNDQSPMTNDARSRVGGATNIKNARRVYLVLSTSISSRTPPYSSPILGSIRSFVLLRVVTARIQVHTRTYDIYCIYV